jgi:hypothetical protein
MPVEVYAVLLALLGSDDYQVRRAATDQLTRQPLILAFTTPARLADPEIAARLACAARRAMWCRACRAVTEPGWLSQLEAAWWADDRWLWLEAAGRATGGLKPAESAPWDCGYLTRVEQVRGLANYCRSQRSASPIPWPTPWRACAYPPESLPAPRLRTAHRRRLESSEVGLPDQVGGPATTRDADCGPSIRTRRPT